MSASRTIIPQSTDKRRVEVHYHEDGSCHVSLWVRRGLHEHVFDLPLLTADEVKVLAGKLNHQEKK